MRRLDDGSIGYSWEDLRPIHRLMTVAIAAQLLGALTGFGLRGDTDWFDAAWLGGAFATFPGFVAGFFYQAATDAVGLRDNKVMVAFCGGISLLLTLAAWMLLARQ
jgi:hypothetical protein